MRPRLPFKEAAWILFDQTIRAQGEPFQVGDFVAMKNSKTTDALGKILRFQEDRLVVLCPKEKASSEGFWNFDWVFSENSDFVEIETTADEILHSAGYSLFTVVSFVNKMGAPHCLYEYPRGLLTRDLCPTCWHEKCNDPAVGVGFINIWGSISPVVMCEKHTDWNGCGCDTNPFSNRSQSWHEAMRVWATEQKAKEVA